MTCVHPPSIEEQSRERRQGRVGGRDNGELSLLCDTIYMYLPLRKYWMDQDEGTSAHVPSPVGVAYPETHALTLLSSWSLELS